MLTQPNLDDRFLELLRRWLEGDFTRADERELKMMTDSDDFLREAMEGFAATPEADHSARLQALRARLLKHPENVLKSTPGGLYKWRPWMAAAASIALLLLAWWYVPRWTSKNEDSAAMAIEPPASVLLAGPDTVALEMETITAPGSGSVKKDVSDVAARPSPEANILSAPRKPDQSAADPPPPPAGDVAFYSEALATPKTTGSDDQESKTVQAAPRVDYPDPSASDKRPSTAALPAREIESAKLKKQPPAARASGAATRKKDAEQWHETDQKPSLDSVRAEALVDLAAPEESAPAEGWDAFNEYLRLNARLTERARNNNITGAVRVQFSVDEDGNPGGFIFLRSQGYGLDEEAVRLIKSREWLRGTRKQNVTVEVRFVR